MPGLCCRWSLAEKSVPAYERPAEFVADPGNDRLDIARLGVKAVRAEQRTKLIALALESGVIVLDAGNPVLGNAVFPAGADRPAVVPLVVGTRTGERQNGIDDGEVAADPGITALGIEQAVADGIADAAGNGRHPVAAPAEHIVLRAERGVEQGAPVIHCRRRALETEHEIAGLPVVTDLAAAE